MSYLREFDSILEDHVHVSKNLNQDLALKKMKRKYINERLEQLLQSMEDSWLGFQKCSLLGSFKREEDKTLVEQTLNDCFKSKPTKTIKEYLRTLISASCYLSSDQLALGISEVFPKIEREELNDVVKIIKSKLDKLSDAPREPVILILDPEVQALPWETLPCMRSSHQAVSRAASLPYLHSLWSAHATDHSSVVSSGVAQDNVFYVLNPDKTCKRTEEKIGDVIKKWENWEGIVGEIPEKQQLQTALRDKDAFMYCGHGSGSQVNTHL